MRNLKAIIIALAMSLVSTSVLAQCGTQAPANKFCGNDTGITALATWKSVPTGALSPIAGGTVLGNRGTGSAVPTPLTNPVLGIPGTSTGEVGLAGLTSGTAVLRAQAVAGSAVSLLPTAAGTLVGTAAAPLLIGAATGQITCPTCVTSSGGGAITGTAPISVSAAGVVSINAPYVTLTASNGGIVYSGPTNLAILAGTATARQMLQSGASTTPAWSTAVWPATTTINQLLFSDAANNVTGLATANGGVLNTSATGVPSITATPLLGVAGTTMGTIRLSGSGSGVVTITPQAAAGTVTQTLPNASGTFAISATGALVLSATTGALTCPTCVTSSGGGAITGTAPIAVSAAGVVSINAPYVTLTASNGGIVYSGATNLAILAGTATANLPLISGSSTTPAWATITYPTSATSGGIAYFSSTTVMASSSAFGTTEILRGGGVGNPPVSTVCGTSTTILHGGSPPTCGQLVYADISSAAIASASNYFTGASSVLIPADQIYQAEVTVTYGATTTVDFNTLINGVVTLTGNISTLTLSNVKAGKAGQIRLIQDGTGSRTWPAGGNTVFKYASGVLPALSTTASAVDVLAYSCSSATFCTASLLKDVRNP